MSASSEPTRDFRDVYKDSPVREVGVELYGGDPDCEHEIYDAYGGGVKCVLCRAWFCF